MKGRMNFTEQPDNVLARTIIGLAMKVHRVLGSGYSETVYRNCMIVELEKAGIPFKKHPSITVMYEGVEVGVYQADLLIADSLIVELKVASGISDEHVAQLVNYLMATMVENGLVINFGASSLQFRTKTRSYRPKNGEIDLHS
jgi:GxxExxY protein